MIVFLSPNVPFTQSTFNTAQQSISLWQAWVLCANILSFVYLLEDNSEYILE